MTVHRPTPPCAKLWLACAVNVCILEEDREVTWWSRPPAAHFAVISLSRLQQEDGHCWLLNNRNMSLINFWFSSLTLFALIPRWSYQPLSVFCLLHVSNNSLFVFLFLSWSIHRIVCLLPISETKKKALAMANLASLPHLSSLVFLPICAFFLKG